MKRILVVSNDKEVQAAIANTFKESEYELITADSGIWALDLFETVDIDLVISDLRIPLMSGYDLLTKVKEQYPSVIRIIMSGITEEASVFKAILNNVAKFYLLKPWGNLKLLDYINQIFETEETLKSKDLLNLINNIDKLPTIQDSYQKILNMIERDADTTSVAKEIEKDYAISTKLLQIANSAYYGLQTGSVKHATIYLGQQNLKSLIYSTAIMNSFGGFSPAVQERIQDLWTHALLTSKLLHYIYEVFLGKKLPDTASSAGLLHNIGTLILINAQIEDYVKAISAAQPKLLNLLEVEREAFRVTHQEAGGYLVSWWKLPFPIVEAALYHHTPLDPNVINQEVVAAVHIAQHYAWILTKLPVVTPLIDETFDLLSIPKDNFEAAVNWNKWL